MHNITIQLVSSNTGKQVTQFCNPFDYTLSQLFMENIQVTHDPACNSKLLLFTALRYKYTGKKTQGLVFPWTLSKSKGYHIHTCFLASRSSELSLGLRWGEFFLTNDSTLAGGKCRAASPTCATGMSYGSTNMVPSGSSEWRSCCCLKCSAARCCLHVLKRISWGSSILKQKDRK